MSPHRLNPVRLTVVAQQQAGLPVFIHIDGCDKIHLQVQMSPRSKFKCHIAAKEMISLVDLCHLQGHHKMKWYLIVTPAAPICML